MSQFNPGLVSSARQDWSTPQGLFEYWHWLFRFSLDAAASADNAKCPRFFSSEDNGLDQSWAGQRVWLNPPYGREIGLWVYKAALEAEQGALVVALLKFAPDTRWWRTIEAARATVLPLHGRVTFGGPGKGNAPFASAIVIFWPYGNPGAACLFGGGLMPSDPAHEPQPRGAEAPGAASARPPAGTGHSPALQPDQAAPTPQEVPS